MSIASRFNRAGTTPTAPIQAQQARGPARSRWAGVKTLAPRAKMPDVGLYRLRFLGAEERLHPKKRTQSFKANFEIVALENTNKHKVGEEVTIIEMLSGGGALFGLPRVKAFVLALAGYSSEEAFDEYDPESQLIEALIGAPNDYAADAQAMAGRLVDVCVEQGNDITNPTTGQSTGDFYRVYTWLAVPPEEQRP